MILGLGVDVVKISRIEAAASNPKFLPRIFTPSELQSLKGIESVAGLWAAKEASIKSVGRAIPWRHIEILPDDLGKPRGRFLAEPELESATLHVSISHDGGVAVGFAVLER